MFYVPWARRFDSHGVRAPSRLYNLAHLLNCTRIQSQCTHSEYGTVHSRSLEVRFFPRGKPNAGMTDGSCENLKSFTAVRQVVAEHTAGARGVKETASTENRKCVLECDAYHDSFSKELLRAAQLQGECYKLKRQRRDYRRLKSEQGASGASPTSTEFAETTLRWPSQFAVGYHSMRL